MTEKKKDTNDLLEDRLINIFKKDNSITTLIEDPRYKLFINLGWSFNYDDRFDACTDFIGEYGSVKNDFWLQLAYKHLVKKEKAKLLISRNDVKKAECYIKHRYILNKSYDRALCDTEKELISKRIKGSSTIAIQKAYNNYKKYFSELIRHIATFSL